MNITRKLRAWHELLSAEHIAGGKTWYRDARVFAQSLADTYGVSVPQAAGVIACLSPHVSWEINKRDAERLCIAWQAGVDIDGLAAYAGQVIKAQAILALPQGTDESVVATYVAGRYGPKTRAFYWNILHPTWCLHVTIDRWIFRALLGIDTIQGGNKYVAAYRDMAKQFIDYAQAAGWVPCELQAAVWHCVREHMEARETVNVRPAASYADPEIQVNVPF